jgi:hypothetical protein
MRIGGKAPDGGLILSVGIWRPNGEFRVPAFPVRFDGGRRSS